jgi:Ca-activated chloride channel family protein
MNFFRAAAFLSFAAAPALAQGQAPTIRVETHLVTLTFTVRDAGGKLVSGLNAGDFSVYEDGVPQTISIFAHESDLPLHLGLLVDASSSQDKFMRPHLRDIHTFLGSVLESRDQVFALCFGNHLRIAAGPTSDATAVIGGIERYGKDPGSFPELDPDDTREGGTALYDAIVTATTHELAGRSDGRKAVLLFTDGEENASGHDELDAIASAQDANVLLYAIRYTETHRGKMTADNRHGMTALHHLAEQTGGRDFDALKSDLPEVFRQIGDELRSLYVIGYYSTNKSHDGSFRKVVIEPHAEGLSVRARSGYYAK